MCPTHKTSHLQFIINAKEMFYLNNTFAIETLIAPATRCDVIVTSQMLTGVIIAMKTKMWYLVQFVTLWFLGERHFVTPLQSRPGRFLNHTSHGDYKTTPLGTRLNTEHINVTVVSQTRYIRHKTEMTCEQ